MNKATTAGEIVLVFAHHSPAKLAAGVKDEAAPACSKVKPLKVAGCDPDPRRSTPVRLEDDVVGLMHRHPNAIAWIAGHSRRNGVKPISSPKAPVASGASEHPPWPTGRGRTA